MKGELVVEVLSRQEQIATIEADWRRLWKVQARPEIFTSFDWSMAALDCQVDAARPHVIVVRRMGVVAGLLALVVDGKGFRFMSGPRSDYNDILVDDAEPAAVVATALRAAMGSGGPGRGRLAEIPEWAQLAQALDGLPKDIRRRLRVYPESTCPALRLGQGQDREALLKDMTSKKSLKRHEKKLEKSGPITLRHIEDRAGISTFLDDFFAQHVARRAVVGDQSLFLQAEPRHFYQSLVARLDPAQELRFAVLEAGGRPVAYHFGFEVAGRFTWYKPSFDVDFIDAGAGEVLLKRLLEYLKDRPVHEFDFTRGNESFKDRFSNHRGQNTQLWAHSSAWGARVAGWLWELKAYAKEKPWVADIHRRLRRRGGQPAPATPSPLRTPMTFQRLTESGSSAGLPTSIAASLITLRPLADKAARGDPALGPGLLRDAVARVLAGDLAFLVRDGELTLGLGLVQVKAPAAAEPSIPAREPASARQASTTVEYRSSTAGAPDATALLALLQAVARHTGQDAVTLLIDTGDAGALREATAAGGVALQPAGA